MFIVFTQAFAIEAAEMHWKMALCYSRYLELWVHTQIAGDKMKRDLTALLGQGLPSPLMAK